MHLRVLISLLALALALPAAAQEYTKQGKLSDLRVGTHYWGEVITNADLQGKVVLVQLAGL